MTTNIPKSIRLPGGKYYYLDEVDRKELASMRPEMRAKVLTGLRFAFAEGLVGPIAAARKQSLAQSLAEQSRRIRTMTEMIQFLAAGGCAEGHEGVVARARILGKKLFPSED